MSIADLFFAGTDTTATTIRWGIIYLTQNPDVQGTWDLHCMLTGIHELYIEKHHKCRYKGNK